MAKAGRTDLGPFAAALAGELRTGSIAVNCAQAGSSQVNESFTEPRKGLDVPLGLCGVRP